MGRDGGACMTDDNDNATCGICGCTLDYDERDVCAGCEFQRSREDAKPKGRKRMATKTATTEAPVNGERKTPAQIEADRLETEKALAAVTLPETPKPKATVPLDQTLRLAGQLDRLLRRMDPHMREWAIEFLRAKYLGEGELP